MRRKTLKISLLLIALSISIIIPIFAISVTAKKEGHTSGPVYINDDIPGMTWADWSVQPWLKGSGTEEDPYVIKDLVIDVSGSIFAMMIQDSGAHFRIMKCTFSNGGIEGEMTAGLILINTQNGTIFKNQLINNAGAGIAVIGCLHIRIQKNLCSENGVGIYVQWGMFTTIKQNDCKNNLDSGIVIASAHKNIIEKNDCFENNAGITLMNSGEPDHSPKDNIIYANNLENNQVGIFSTDADMNDILRNTIAENFYGILFGLGSAGNTVYHNNFIDNTVQVVDYQPSMNNWHHPYMEEGNFWSDASFGYDEHPFVEKNGWEFMTPIEEEILSIPDYNRLGGDREVRRDETSYIRYGVMQLFSERVEGEAYPPYTVRVNGTEVVDSVWIFQEETSFGEPGLMQLYYIKFDPYYFTLGYHEYHVEISCYDCGLLTVFSFTTGFTVI